jgi:hypothetical protein
VRARLAVAFSLIALIAVVASALATLWLGQRRAEAEMMRRLTAAGRYSMAMLAAERDRNRSDTLEIASRPSVIQAVQVRDSATLNRILTSLRAAVRDDLLAVYAGDGTLLAADQILDLRLDEPIGPIRAALAGATYAEVLVAGGRLMIAAASPVMNGAEPVGAVLAIDAMDERFARRLGTIADVQVALTIEQGPTVATDAIGEAPLTAEQWAWLRGHSDIAIRPVIAGRPTRALARPLLGADNRLVGALVVALAENQLTVIEPADMPLYLLLNGGVLVGMVGLGLAAAWGLSRRLGLRDPPAASAHPPNGVMPASFALTASWSAPEVEVRQLPGLFIDRGRHQVAVGGRTVALTPTEFDLLWLLASEPGRVMPREALLEGLRGSDWQAEPGLLDTHVSNLRRKIEPNPSQPRWILTVRGVGYKLSDPDAEALPPGA